jgi:hypothetical protein
MHRSKIKITELIPGKKVVWLVLDNYFKFTKDKTEWKGTKMILTFMKRAAKHRSALRMRDWCRHTNATMFAKSAWSTYIQNSLRNLIATGKGQPNSAGNPQTEEEKKLGSSHK